MKISSVTLLKTPLDSGYNNVFDDYPSFSYYNNFLVQNYPIIYIGGDLVKASRNNKDGYLILTLNKKYFDIKDYNYAYITRDEGRYVYYFIIGIEEENSNDTSPVVKLTLKYDAFTNNRSNLIDSTISDENHILTRTYEDTIIMNNKLLPYYLTDEKPYTLIDKSTEYPLGTKVLWAKLSVKNDINVIIDYDTTHTQNTQVKLPQTYKNSALKYTNNILVYYVPIGVFENGKLINFYRDCYLKLGAIDPIDGVYKEQLRYFRSFVATIDGHETFNNFYTASDSVLSIELTYFAPYDYYFVDEPQTGEHLVIINIAESLVNYADSLYGLRLYTNSLVFIRDGSSPICYNYYTLGNIIDNECFVLGYDSLKDSEELLINCCDELPRPPTRSEDAVKSVLYTPRYYLPPYKTKTLEIGETEIPLTPISVDYEYKVDFQLNSSFSTLYKHGLRNIIQTRKYASLPSGGQMPLSIDSAQFYLRNNGSQIIARAIHSHIPNISTMMKDWRVGLAETAINVAENAGNSIAQYVDADRKSDMYTMPSNNGMENIIYQDIPIVRNYDVKELSDILKILSKLHHNGININREERVKINFHKTFDYVQTQNCHLPNIPNYSEREEIEKAYDRGITRWHIYERENGYFPDSLINMNKDCINLSNNYYYFYFGGN